MYILKAIWAAELITLCLFAPEGYIGSVSVKEFGRKLVGGTNQVSIDSVGQKSSGLTHSHTYKLTLTTAGSSAAEHLLPLFNVNPLRLTEGAMY